MPTDPLPDLDEVSNRELLAAAEGNVVARRTVEVDRLRLMLAWCDRHGEKPATATPGGPKLVTLGGAGTPKVVDLCLGEFAVAQRLGYLAIRHLAADALDLRHRLPLLWAKVLKHRCEVWLARKVASMSRALSADAVGLVDEAVAAAVNTSPTVVLRIAEAKIIEADPAAHAAKIKADASDTGVWLGRPRQGMQSEALRDEDCEPATRRITAKLPHGAALELDATITELADVLQARHEDSQASGDTEPGPSEGQWRAQAVALLAHPEQAAELLGHDVAAGEREPKKPKRRGGVIHVHLSAQSLRVFGGPGLDAVARVEALGPMLVSQLGELLARRDVTIQPVLDLSLIQRVNAYEHPTRMRQRILARNAGDVFPHASTGSATSAGLDLDHVVEYQPNGPPGQTSDANTAPLARTSHRMKTHLGYQLHQLAPDAYRWVTPHGLARVVTPTGTRDVELIYDDDGGIIGEIYGLAARKT